MLQEERATVQLALISDGRRSFGLVFYKAGAMRWSVLDNEPLIIGFSNGHRDQVVSNVYSNTKEAFTKMDRIKGNTGQFCLSDQAFVIGVRVFCSLENPSKFIQLHFTKSFLHLFDGLCICLTRVLL